MRRITARVKATINGEERELPDETTVGALLELLGCAAHGHRRRAQRSRRSARDEYDDARLRDGDALEIIAAVAGG